MNTTAITESAPPLSGASTPATPGDRGTPGGVSRRAGALPVNSGNRATDDPGDRLYVAGDDDRRAARAAEEESLGGAAAGVANQRPLNPDYTIYKPNGRGTGGVVRWQINRDKGAVFVEAANQSGERQFDWDRKIIMKWSLSDLGQALAVLQGRQPQAKVFHQAEKANSAFDFNRRDDPDKAPYLFTISRQDAADKSVRKVTIPISHGEAAVLETALRAAVTRLLGW